ncbi:hypothetical protein EYF80_067860 [Liparis tanakae]|uniref:Uncharacterized protein n=1 Tax=Liparis tanakae TaxID=230148 RepID=A0A4Z2DZZ9_9TELE|nr:hypothetical protein EYF80_067860 [Liparis tanakae]
MAKKGALRRIQSKSMIKELTPHGSQNSNAANSANKGTSADRGHSVHLRRNRRVGGRYHNTAGGPDVIPEPERCGVVAVS